MNQNQFNDVPPALEQTAQHLQQTLHSHADSVEPLSDSYLTLSNRLTSTAGQPSGGVAHGRFRLPPARILSAAAMFVLVVGTLGTLAIRNRESGDLTAVAPTTTIPDLLPSTTSVPPTTTEPIPPTTTTEPEPPPLVQVTAASEVMGPVRGTPTDAARAFLSLLGMQGNVDFVDTGLDVVRLERDGFVIAELEIAAVEPKLPGVGEESGEPADSVPGFAVTRANSEGMTLDLPPQGVIQDGLLSVSGNGRGFEASIDISLQSAFDGNLLTKRFTTGGSGPETKPFESELNLIGTEAAWVVAASSSGAGGVLTEFAAEPVVYSAGLDSMDYTVFRVSPNDPDGGLNVRDRPGTDEGNVLVTLPPGETGIRRLPRLPALVGDSVWWQVVTSSGQEGWVHSAFLAEQAGSGDAELEQAAEFTTFFIRIGEPDTLAAIPLSRRYRVAMGWLGATDFVTATDDQVRSPEFWESRREWQVPEATFGQSTLNLSVRSLLNLPDDENAAEVLVNALQPYGLDQAVVDSYFAGTESVTVVGPETTEGPWRNVVYFFEGTRNGPELVGIMTSIQVP